MIVKEISLDLFKQYANVSYTAVFGKQYNMKQHRTDGVYCAFDKETFVGFVTYFFSNEDEINLSYGGIVREYRSYNTVKLFKEVLSKLSDIAKIAIMKIKNTNVTMIKLALHTGFIINGYSIYPEGNFCHFIKDLRGDKNG